MQIDEGLKQYATERQIEYIEAVNKHGGYRAAARELNLNHTTISTSINLLKMRAAAKGYSPEHDMIHDVPDPFVVRGTSTLYDKDGNAKLQWVKSRLDDEKYKVLVTSVLEGLKDEIPRAVIENENFHLTNDDLLNCYVITDYHMGMLSWHQETGADWDLAKAETLVVKWFKQAIAHSPDAATAVFAQLSDFLHFDGMDAVTPASKHLLDVDTRFAKVVRSAIRVLRQIISMLLQKHDHVHIIMADANHDPVSQIWLREWFAVFYEEEPRISVDTSPNPYNAYEFGKTALYFHHGHKRKITNLSEVFAAQFREMFGRTKHAYAHTGHLHHVDVKENNLMIVEQHRTLAPADAYAARGGWLSGRDAKVISYHKEYGEVSRLTINSDMLK
jgi:hypothetical protein